MPGQEEGEQVSNNDFEELNNNRMEGNQAMGLLPATEELMQQADEDLEAFRAKVEKTREDEQYRKTQRP